MSSDNTKQRSVTLTTTAHVLLAQLSMRPWSTYDLAEQRVRYFRFVWPRAESAIYREVKKLAARGLAKSHVSYTGKRKRTTYSITDAGMDALRDWMRTPVSPFSMEFEAIIRLLIAPLADTADLTAMLQQVQADADDMLEFAGGVKSEFIAGRNPLQDQAYMRMLAVDFFVSLLKTVRSWTERALDEVAGWDGRTLEERNCRAKAFFEQLSVDPRPLAPEGFAVPPRSVERRTT